LSPLSRLSPQPLAIYEGVFQRRITEVESRFPKIFLVQYWNFLKNVTRGIARQNSGGIEGMQEERM
jgi:hypothetical protein